MTPGFSIVTICKNESLVIPRFVKSLEEFSSLGGVICLLDTGSTDDSAELARSLGCDVHEVGEKFITSINQDLSEKINQKFIVEGEEPIVKNGDYLFNYSDARNFAATLSPTDWILMPDCDEVLTSLDIDRINSIIADPEIDRLEYDFVFAHDQVGKPLVQFMHSKFYRRDKMKWNRIIHEILQPI